MRLRQYNPTDFSYISQWVDSPRVHALWCANVIPYPVTAENFHALLAENAARFQDSVFIATEDTGEPIGFFSYSVNCPENSGFLKYVILDARHRGKGYGSRMLKLALTYAFQLTAVEYVQINVFDVNLAARSCYARLGFTERHTTPDALAFEGEAWDRLNLVISSPSRTE